MSAYLSVYLSICLSVHVCVYSGSFYAIFNALGWESQGQRKAKSVGFILSLAFQLVSMKIDVVLLQFKLSSVLILV